MFRKFIIGKLLLLLLLAAGSGFAQESEFSAELPVLVTSSGQALDAFTVQTLLRRAGVESSYDELIEADGIAEFNTVVIVFGASIKGFGAAGITAETELARTQAIIDAAQEQGITIIGMHVGGEERRGGLSEQFVELVATNADYLIVTAEGNFDGYFDTLATETDVPVVIAAQPIEAGNTLADLF